MVQWLTQMPRMQEVWSLNSGLVNSNTVSQTARASYRGMKQLL